MLIAARTASRPASTTSHRLPEARDAAPPSARDGALPGLREGALPGSREDAISSPARSSARPVARRIDSAAWPVSGASEPASDARSGRARIPAAVIAAAAGCADTSNGTPSGGQQPGSVQTYDQ
jgi:hypothetical protein